MAFCGRLSVVGHLLNAAADPYLVTALMQNVAAGLPETSRNWSQL